MRFLKSRQTLLGIDIQTDAIYIAKLRKNKHHVLIEELIRQPFSAPVFGEGKIKHWDQIEFQLLNVVEQYEWHHMPVAISIPIHLIRLKQLQLPLGLSPHEIEEEIQADLQHDLPGIRDPFCIDFFFLPSTHTEYTEIYSAAVRKNYLQHYIECIQATDLKIKIVDIDLYALKRAILMYAPPCTGWQGTLYLTQDHSSLFIFQAHKIIAYQSWQIQDANNLVDEIILKIETCLISLPEIFIQDLYVCSPENYLAHLISGLKSKRVANIHYPSFANFFHFTTEKPARYFRKFFPHFMLACGLALREPPLW